MHRGTLCLLTFIQRVNELSLRDQCLIMWNIQANHSGPFYEIFGDVKYPFMIFLRRERFFGVFVALSIVHWIPTNEAVIEV